MVTPADSIGLLTHYYTYIFFFFASIFYSLSEKICLYSSFCRILSIFSIILIEIELNKNTYLLHISLDERSDGLLVCCGREGGKYMGGFVRWLAVVGITSLLGNRPSGWVLEKRTWVYFSMLIYLFSLKTTSNNFSLKRKTGK